MTWQPHIPISSGLNYVYSAPQSLLPKKKPYVLFELLVRSVAITVSTVSVTCKCVGTMHMCLYFQRSGGNIDNSLASIDFIVSMKVEDLIGTCFPFLASSQMTRQRWQEINGSEGNLLAARPPLRDAKERTLFTTALYKRSAHYSNRNKLSAIPCVETNFSLCSCSAVY